MWDAHFACGPSTVSAHMNANFRTNEIFLWTKEHVIVIYIREIFLNTYMYIHAK